MVFLALLILYAPVLFGSMDLKHSTEVDMAGHTELLVIYQRPEHVPMLLKAGARYDKWGYFLHKYGLLGGIVSIVLVVGFRNRAYLKTAIL